MKQEEKEIQKACKSFIQAYCEKHNVHASKETIEDATDAGVAAMTLEVANALEIN